MNTRKLLAEVKATGQDFEWYPTTDEMIEVIYQDIKKNLYSIPDRILDLGAGDCRVLTQLDKKLDNYRLKLYAVEKSKPLLDAMPKNVILVGTDFYETSLVDKEVDCIFCNPPYSDFEQWALKIIKTANTKVAYLILPQRWKESELIKSALVDRGIKDSVLASYDFFDGDRQARAKVDVIKFYFIGAKSSFDSIFDEVFSDLSSIFDKKQDKEEQEVKSEIKLSGETIPDLVNAYDDELAYIYQNYKTLGQLDGAIFKELNIDLNNLKEGLKMRISGLKNKYWDKLFDVYEPITSRLTFRSRDRILSKIKSHIKTVDFTLGNCYAITSRVIQSAIDYADDQVIEMFYKLADPESIIKYKSNEKVFSKDRWKYHYDPERPNDNADLETRFRLEYRIVGNGFGTISKVYFTNAYRLTNQWDSYTTRYNGGAEGFLQDLFIVARNLGFDINYTKEQLNELDWDYGKRVKLMYRDFVKKEDIVFCEVKFYKNGNAHLFFNSDFIISLNLAVGRILGWLKTPKEASEELEIPIEQVNDILQTQNKNFNLIFNQYQFLLTSKE